MDVPLTDPRHQTPLAARLGSLSGHQSSERVDVPTNILTLIRRLQRHAHKEDVEAKLRAHDLILGD